MGFDPEIDLICQLGHTSTSPRRHIPCGLGSCWPYIFSGAISSHSIAARNVGGGFFWHLAPENFSGYGAEICGYFSPLIAALQTVVLSQGIAEVDEYYPPENNPLLRSARTQNSDLLPLECKLELGPLGVAWQYSGIAAQCKLTLPLSVSALCRPMSHCTTETEFLLCALPVHRVTFHSTFILNIYSNLNYLFSPPTSSFRH